VEFMYALWKAGRGGILGDDMGLGSTLHLHLNQFVCRLSLFGRDGASDCVSNSRVW
jgi:hypothetical protein